MVIRKQTQKTCFLIWFSPKTLEQETGLYCKIHAKNRSCMRISIAGILLEKLALAALGKEETPCFLRAYIAGLLFSIVCWAANMTPMNSGLTPWKNAKHVKWASHWEHLRSSDHNIIRFKMLMRPSSKGNNRKSSDF